MALVRQFAAAEVSQASTSGGLLTTRVQEAAAHRLASMYGLSLVAALRTALATVYEDKKRTLPLHVRAITPAGAAAWLSSGGSAASGIDLFAPCPGVDASRPTAEVLLKALLSEVASQHQAIIATQAEVITVCVATLAG
jgi:hypothetical protein